MTRILGCVVALALAAGTAADVQIFFTSAEYSSPWAEGGPANVFSPSGMHGEDYMTDGYVPAPNWAHWPTAPQMGTVYVLSGEVAYVWIHFDNANGLPVSGAKLQGLQLVYHRVGDPNPAYPPDLGYYYMDERGPNGLGGSRWDGDLGVGGINFKQNPQMLVGVTANGIVNSSVSVPANLYRGGPYGDSSRTALLGAVRVLDGTFTFSLGPSDISFNIGGTPDVQFGSVSDVPEPQTWLLLVFAGALWPRRR